MGHPHGSHDGAVVVDERRLVRLELAHAALRLHLLVEQERRARAHGLLLGFQAHELSLRVLVGRDVPYIVVSAPLHLVLRLAHRLAERVVHLEVGAARVLEPHELGYGVDGGVEVLLREGQVGVAFRRALQPGELESGPRRVERSRPQRVERPVVLRRPACRLGGVGNDRHGAVERVESHAPPRHEVRKAARRPGAARRVGEEPQVDDGDVAGAERLGFQRGEGLDRMLEPIEGRRAAQGLLHGRLDAEQVDAQRLVVHGRTFQRLIDSVLLALRQGANNRLRFGIPRRLSLREASCGASGVANLRLFARSAFVYTRRPAPMRP